MTEQIGKVTLDYTFYNGQDQYSDGDIENDLLQLIMEEPDVEKILAEDDRWPDQDGLPGVRRRGSGQRGAGAYRQRASLQPRLEGRSPRQVRPAYPRGPVFTGPLFLPGKHQKAPAVWPGLFGCVLCVLQRCWRGIREELVWEDGLLFRFISESVCIIPCK